MSLISLSTRTAMDNGSYSAASKASEYSPLFKLSNMKLPFSSVVVVTLPGVKVTFTPSIAVRVARDTTLPLIPPFCAATVSEIKDNTMIRKLFIFISISVLFAYIDIYREMVAESTLEIISDIGT